MSEGLKLRLGFPRSFHTLNLFHSRWRNLTLVKSTVPILLWLFHTALLTFENTFAECTLHLGRIFHELFNWNIIRLGDKLKGTDEPEVDSAAHLVLDQVENLLFHLTIYTVETFKTSRAATVIPFYGTVQGAPLPSD